jgi:TonB-dependent receptor
MTKPVHSSLRTRLAGSAAIFVLCGGTAAAENVNLSLPDQSLSQSLTEIASKTGTNILFAPDVVSGLRGRALVGSMDAQQAVRNLIVETNLESFPDGNGGLIVRRTAGQPLIKASVGRNQEADNAPAYKEPPSRLAALHSGFMQLAQANTAAAQSSPNSDTVETVTVTGYRASLESSTNAKRNSVGFTDTIYAEDIGKFPDTNLAESLNRIPGITLTRDINGEGTNISIRGLGTNFTKILLNNTVIAVSTTGVTDARNNNREVDLNMFPGELFTQLQVDKTPRAELLEGGAAGTVNMRTRRPFDNPGFHLTYVAQAMDNSQSNGLGGNGALVVSDTWDNTKIGSFGFLVGIAGKRAYNYLTGFEDGNAGWVTPTVNTAAMCGAASGCDISGSAVSIGGNSMTIPATVPANVSIPGYAPGSPVNAAMLLAINPGLNMTQISNMLLPRLGRPMYERGTRDRYNMVASFEWRPTDNLHFYLDMIGGRPFNDWDRSDMSLGVRAGSGSQPMIPMNVKMDSNYVVTSGSFANAQFAMEARNYKEKGDFFSINPGMSWNVTDLFQVDFQVNASRSHFYRDMPTIFLVTCPSAGSGGAPSCAAPVGGVTAKFDNSGPYPVTITNIDTNNPANFQWSNGLMRIQDTRRYTQTVGAHLDLSYGGETMKVKVGAAYDDAYRSNVSIDASNAWQIAACGSPVTPNGNGTCTGSGGLIPTSALANYLKPGQRGYVTVDYAAFNKASNYAAIGSQGWAGVHTGCKDNTSSNFTTSTNDFPGCYEERNVGLYGQLDGLLTIGSRDLLYDIGLRWTQTLQTVISPIKLGDGSLANTYYNFGAARSMYQAFLPSANIVYKIADDFQIRASISRTINRPDVSKMIAAVNFADITANSAALGNPDLKPYFSNNIDLGVEYYTGGEGYLSLALFRKGISGFTVSANSTVPWQYMQQFGISWSTITGDQQTALRAKGCTSDTSCPATVTVTQQVNAPGMETINGMEFGYVQPLDFLLEEHGLKGLGVTANLTIVDQSSSGSAAVHAMGVAPYTYNLTGYYENNGIMARISYNFTDRSYASASNTQSVCLPTIGALGAGCPAGAYLFTKAYGQADISSSLKLSRLAGDLPSDPELTFDVQNVFNAKQRMYDQYTNAIHNYYAAGQTFMFGIHGTF